MGREGNSFVYIVDSLTVAMAVDIIIRQSENNNILLVFEKKRGIDDHIDIEYLSKHIFPALAKVDSIRVDVPSPYFLGRGRSRIAYLAHLCRLGRMVRPLIGILNSNATLVGPRTSSIMLCATDRNRQFIDHGYGEYATRVFTINSRMRRWIETKKYLLKSLLRIPCTRIISETQSFTLCKLNNDATRHLCYRNSVISPSLEEDLNARYGSGKKKLVILLAGGNRHTESRLPSYEPWRFDRCNYELILRYASKDDFVLIKFHGSLYAEGKLPVSNLPSMLGEVGIEARIFESCLGPVGTGNLPAEVIIKALNVKKVVSECSATVCNVSHVGSMDLICDFRDFPDFHVRNFNHYSYLAEINKQLALPFILEPKSLI